MLRGNGAPSKGCAVLAVEDGAWLIGLQRAICQNSDVPMAGQREEKQVAARFFGPLKYLPITRLRLFKRHASLGAQPRDRHKTAVRCLKGDPTNFAIDHFEPPGCRRRDR